VNLIFPFTAITGQDELKLCLILNAVNPDTGGVLIRGEKGTAKSTAVRSMAELLPGADVITLPLNATEDRIAGGIDFNRAVKEGRTIYDNLRKTVLASMTTNAAELGIVILGLSAVALGNWAIPMLALQSAYFFQSSLPIVTFQEIAEHNHLK